MESFRPLSVGEYKKPNTGSDDAAKIFLTSFLNP